jgi:hypothetical protein
MKTTFQKPSDAIGLSAVVKVTLYKATPYVRGGVYVEEIMGVKEVIIPLDPTLLTYDTFNWSGYYLNLVKLADKAGSQFIHPCSVLLIGVI